MIDNRFDRRYAGLNEYDAKKLFSEKIWQNLEGFVQPYKPWPGQFKTKYEGKTFFAKAKPVIIDRPPIVKVVKQPVIVRQPVIVEKVIWWPG